MQPVEAQLAHGYQDGIFYLGEANEYTTDHNSRKILCNLRGG
jgi:hypothetical protein